MASPQLLDATIRSDGVVREAPYSLLCMVVAVEKAHSVTTEATSDLFDIYLNERDVTPFERVLQAADEFSFQKNAMKAKITLKRERKAHEDDEEEASAPQAGSVHAQTEFKRLVHSTSRIEVQKRLEEQLENLKLEQIREVTGVSLPKHLQITTLEEDPLEFRRDMRGVAQIWGRNVLGDHYAPKTDPLRFLHTHMVPDLFKRMKRVVRDDLSTRNKRRIVALNAKERKRKKELERQGILSPEQQLEAKFDQLLNASVA
ncbi:hypothetical protein JG687_00007018 [Phytophthora cactorum]|uniref:Uncharacterized protein n=1 Tax=Phytophthora cactorum TaxID=29920 RepID=A0A329SMT0_9STRA|nr:hypothetical protein Pcac1_g4540 [Phytophthora cactorum]KAG2818155.1 hypothetical protein PC112_g12757 [Phytophthora cactorum]KAG2820427.1 hypothetical protein PC111_g11469 [Phytophthora cactorum]KAG2854778.1 hypothetical protein PC113_g13012 [Phytophthora cactorum]KAG2899948.1 hypothetical protein PC114_g13720 [Phytophthora cactorum]